MRPRLAPRSGYREVVTASEAAPPDKLPSPAAATEAEVIGLAREIAGLADDGQGRRFRSSAWWSDRMLGWAMSHPSFRTALFRFVDVFPATEGDADVVRHLFGLEEEL